MTGQNVLDAHLLQELKMVMGADFPLLLDTFERDSRQRLLHVQQACDQADFEGLRHTAHSFKGSSGNLGAQQLANLCQTIETAAREQDLAAVQAALAPLPEALEQALAALRAAQD